MGFSIPPNPLRNYKIQKYYQNGRRVNGAFSRDNVPKKTKDEKYVIKIDEYADACTHWIDLFRNRSEFFYLDSFDVGNVPEEIKEFVGNKPIKANIFRVQANNSIMYKFIDFILACKKLTSLTSLFSLYDFKKNIILSYFKNQ